MPSAKINEVSDTKSDQFVRIEFKEKGFPVIPGGLFREAVIEHLVPSDS